MTSLQIRITRAAPAAPYYTGYRALFDVEGGRIEPRTPNPRVVPSLNVPGVEFTEAMQLLSWELMVHANPNVTKEKWRAVYGGTRAFTNTAGWDIPGKPQRADYVNRRDLDCELPRLMKGIICQGNFYRGSVVGDELVITPGVGAIDVALPLPSIQEVLDRNWYFVATTGGQGSYNNFPQGAGGPVLIPYFLNTAARYVASWFEEWDADRLPNPLVVGG